MGVFHYRGHRSPRCCRVGHRSPACAPGTRQLRAPRRARPPARGARAARAMSGSHGPGHQPRPGRSQGRTQTTRFRLVAVPVSDDEAGIRTAAVELFVERACGVRGDSEPSPTTNRTVVFELCRRLDGIPLALELAAAGAHADARRRSSSGSTTRLPHARRGRARPPRTPAHAAGDDRLERPAALGRRAGAAPAPGRLPRGLRASMRSSGWPTELGRRWTPSRRSARSSTAASCAEQDRGSRAWFTMLATVREYGRDLPRRARTSWPTSQERHADFYVELAAAADSVGDLAGAGRAGHAPPRRARRVAGRGRSPLRGASLRRRRGARLAAVLVLVGRRPGRRAPGRGWTRLLEPGVELSERSQGRSPSTASTPSATGACRDESVVPAMVRCVDYFQQGGRPARRGPRARVARRRAVRAGAARPRGRGGERPAFPRPRRASSTSHSAVRWSGSCAAGSGSRRAGATMPCGSSRRAWRWRAASATRSDRRSR